jgi:hypothetical protein
LDIYSHFLSYTHFAADSGQAAYPIRVAEVAVWSPAASFLAGVVLTVLAADTIGDV